MKKRGRPPVPWKERHAANVVEGGPDECWPWKGCATKTGYGMLNVNGVTRGAHCLAWELDNGKPVPEGLEVQHLCNNPRCCNPKHLIVGTRKENMEYKVQCNRQPRGEKHGRAKLTDADAKEVIRLLAEGHLTQEQIGKQMGVFYTAIYKINVGENWKHISPETPRPIRRREAA